MYQAGHVGPIVMDGRLGCNGCGGPLRFESLCVPIAR
jgi:hypothetical protein